MAQEITTSFSFTKINQSPLVYRVSITFPNELYTQSVNWVEDRNNPGTFRFFNLSPTENWSALEAGIAAIYAFLNDANDPELEKFALLLINLPWYIFYIISVVVILKHIRIVTATVKIKRDLILPHWQKLP